MSLNSDIRTIVEAIAPDATYILSSWFKANRNSYNLETMTPAAPYIILDNEQTEDNEIQENSNILSNTQIKMWFLFKSDVYDSDEEMEAGFDEIKPLVNQIAVNIYQLDGIRLKGSELAKYKLTKKFKIFNSVLCGWEFSANWRYNTIANWCKTQQSLELDEAPDLDYVPDLEEVP